MSHEWKGTHLWVSVGFPFWFELHRRWWASQTCKERLSTMLWRWTDRFIGKRKLESKQRVLDSICFLLKVSSKHFTQPIATCHPYVPFFGVCLTKTETGKQSLLHAVKPARYESTALVVRVNLKEKTISWHRTDSMPGLMAVLCNHECSYRVLIMFIACITHQYRFHEFYSFHVMSLNLIWFVQMNWFPF